MALRRTSVELDQLRDYIRDLASAQGGVFRRSDLIAWGIEPTLAVTMKRNGAWLRLHHGVYADARTVEAARDPLARHALLAAATLAAVPEGMWLFGPSSCAVMGIPVDRAILGPVHLVRLIGSDSRALRRRITANEHLPEAVIHVLDVPEELLTVHSGLATVNKDFAACGAAMMSDLDWAVASLDAVAFQDEGARGRLEEISLLWPRLAGAGTLNAALPHVRTGAQTPLESLSRLKLIRGGLPEPSLQVPFYDEDGLIGIVDMLFDDLGVVGEADGDVKYENRRVLLKEKSREDRIRRQGPSVVRWGWSAAMGSMKETIRDIKTAGTYSAWRKAG